MKLVIILIVILSIPAVCFAEITWYVDDDNISGPWSGSQLFPFQYIQNGIDVAFNGNTVLVMPGTYVENINFKGKAITVKSSKGPDVTVINGNQNGSVVTFNHSEGPDSRIEGFKITNGSGTWIFSTFYSGGGIFCSGASPTITNNIVTDNSVNNEGGGICCSYSMPTISNNIISENYAYWKGGGIYCNNSSPTVTNNMIIGNTCSTYGGGICYDWTYWTITNNTIRGNSAARGGGLCSINHSSPTVTNTILWENYASEAGSEIYVDSPSSNPTVSYCDVNEGWPGTGNIDTDPLFVDPSGGDFHLSYMSPCRNTGDNSAAGIPTEDYEGDHRVAYGIVDMGADEFYPHLYYKGNATPAGSIDVKFVGLPGTTQVILIYSLNIFDSPIPCDFGYWYLDFFMEFLFLGPISSDGLYVLPVTIPTTPPAPYTVYGQACINYQLTNLCIFNIQ